MLYALTWLVPPCQPKLVIDTCPFDMSHCVLMVAMEQPNNRPFSRQLEEVIDEGDRLRPTVQLWDAVLVGQVQELDLALRREAGGHARITRYETRFELLADMAVAPLVPRECRATADEYIDDNEFAAHVGLAIALIELERSGLTNFGRGDLSPGSSAGVPT